MFKSIDNSRLFTQWIQQCINTILLCLIFVFSEWIFCVTQPSYLTSLDLFQNGLVLLKGFILISGICCILLIILGLVSILFKEKTRIVILKASSFLPSVILAVLSLMIIDNFTYTVFGVGIVTSQGIARGLYVVVLLCCGILGFKLFLFFQSLKVRHVYIKCSIIWVILFSSLLVFPFNHKTNLTQTTFSSEKLPNIILIGSDGLSADHMSVYGYNRETTPNISKFAEDALVVENNFTNSIHTSGSLISIFTSKYPTQTRVLYPPDIISGDTAKEHLPAILKRLGYYNIELSFPHYADAYTLGMIGGFDYVNGKTPKQNAYLRLINTGFSINDAYFLSLMLNRISERIPHIFFINNMDNYFDIVKKNMWLIKDEKKLSELLSFLDTPHDNPLFIHVHFVGTHGPRLFPKNKVYSKGIEQDQDWMIDYYDDCVLEFDRLFGELLDEMKVSGLLENTIIIIYSDHAMKWSDLPTIPLIIRFPHGEYSNLTINQAENLDIAPTILDYLNISKPDWMEGQSLINSDYVRRPVISTGTNDFSSKDGVLFATAKVYRDAPFYQFDYLNLVYCQKWYKLDLDSFELVQGTIEGYRNLCREEDLMSKKEVLQTFQNHLERDGFIIPDELMKVFQQE